MTSRIVQHSTRQAFQRLHFVSLSVSRTPSRLAPLSTFFAHSSVRLFSDSSSSSSKEADEIKEDITLDRESTTANQLDEATAAEETLEEDSRERQLEEQLLDMKDQLLRSLAEQENTRRIARRDVESARNFAIKSFAKSLLDTSDNLAMALDAVPEDMRADKEGHAVLANLYEGIQMTHLGLTKAFEQNGLAEFGKIGDVFDPNHHEALFQYPDPNLEAGTIGQVMKKGFFLNNRVLRPAEVGVVKK